ncbi:hypothetical protein D6V68_15880 [Escherichia albertii]|nr:hypothetical protein [Escherichia albertii]EFO0110145.1 hypothetical protein [Escherichia albertii]MLY52295.1 hypothetical protein [Escherichia albertii]QTA22834.1 hypothetical protein FYK18_19100 [Escherichia albertii]
MSRNQEDPRGEPESTTLLTLLPVLLSQPGAGFFLRVILSTGSAPRVETNAKSPDALRLSGLHIVLNRRSDKAFTPHPA